MNSESGKDIYIRRFKESDVPALLRLVSQIASAEDLTQSASAQFYGELENPDHEGGRFVATQGSMVIGTMGCTAGPIPSKQVLWADWLIVDNEYRRYGIASLLYAEIEKYALEQGKRYLCLDIGNIDRERAAYLFHLRNGFQIVGQLPDYWGEFEHLNIMAKLLNSRD
ncbi:GNAT family N-acetyltransferase [Pseudomonas sp. SK3(2021)]|uniref:GNAT family N-acetyltransferase n=1 Tax=Pseudomonas sp. SK3(2021) TaxID=2841064 RepID=UPI00192C4BE3|nr:GNAT family N-acetyltransferase [Pseudomonas sp. SK3(2021)]QQZ39507.1 GNAT family N-acetyltransferase [Pseudomonas sp. SK3(2021)]